MDASSARVRPRRTGAFSLDPGTAARRLSAVTAGTTLNTFASMQRIPLYVHTIAHLRPAQVVARLGLQARRTMRQLAPRLSRQVRMQAMRGVTVRAVPPMALGLPPAHDESLIALVRANASGTWTFLSTTAALGMPVDWHAASQSQLWRYHLHYFDDAPMWVQAGDEGGALFRDLVRDWIARVRCGDAAHRDPWHPYPVSLRLVNWLLAHAARPDLLAGDASFDASLREHAAFLAANLERDVEGNHLLKNLKAVAFASLCFDGWTPVDRAVAAFTAALEAQTLADGVHYERSPMYHCQVLADALEIVAALASAGQTVPADLARVTARLRGALDRLLHPDGEIALLGDSAIGQTFAPSELVALYSLLSGCPCDGLASRHRLFAHLASRPPALGPPIREVPITGALAVDAPSHPRMHSGIVTLAASSMTVIADVGAACPDELPAHAHADTLGFELSLGRSRFIVDTGVSEYRAGAWRSFERSTRAHNTVEVDGADSTECWSAFRAARRARVTHAETIRSGAWQVISATHDGYRRLPSPVLHTRDLALHDDGCLVVRDRLAGSGRHAWAVFLHVHPSVDVTPSDEAALRLARDGAALRLTWHGLPTPRVVAGVDAPLQGWYAERFGQRQPAPVIVWSGDGTLPVSFAFALSVDDDRAKRAMAGVDLAALARGDDERWYDTGSQRDRPTA